MLQANTRKIRRMLRLCVGLLALLMLLSAVIACTPQDDPITGETLGESDTTPEVGTTPDTEDNTEDGTESDTEAVTEIEVVPETPYPVDCLRLGGVNISEFSVVCPADAPEVQRTAVDCLVARVAEATGYTLPVITPDQSAEHEIVFGHGLRENARVDAAVAEIKNDGYALVMDGGDLYIAATTGRGTVYGVYGLMEDYFGVRFYAKDCIMYKEANLIDLDAELCEVNSPAFAYRGGNWHAEWGDYGYAVSKANEGDMRGYGDDIILYSYSGHFLSMFIDSVDGKWDDSGWDDPNPCLSGEETYQKALANVLLMIDSGPYDSVRVGQTDHRGHCECEDCTALNEKYQTEGGSYFYFVNRLANDIAELRPGVNIQSYAYTFSTTPPVGLELADNLIINYCLGEACGACDLDDPDCERNAIIAKELAAWVKVAACVTTYDYANNFSGNSFLDPSLHVLRKHARYLAEIGVDSYGVETWVNPGGDFDELRHYMIRQIMWDPMISEEEFNAKMNEFMEDYYGEAAPYLMEYINATSAQVATPSYISDNSVVVPYSGHPHIVYTSRHCFYDTYTEEGKQKNDMTLAMYALWEQAFEANLTEEQLLHVERASVHFYKWCVDFLPRNIPETKEARNRYEEFYAKHELIY